MIKDVEILRQSIRAITQILTESDVMVTQRGMDAYTKCHPTTGKITQINLPYLPDDAPESLIQAVQGYLDHEVGHALFTDWSVVGSIKDDLTKQLHNIVEDAFVERKMTERFRGCAYNLGNVSAFYREKYLDKVIAGGEPDEIKKALAVAAIRALSGQESYADYMTDKWHYLDDFKAKIEPLSAMLTNTKTTQDCLTAAVAIKKALTDEKPEQPPQPPSEEKPEENNEHEDDDEGTKSNKPEDEEGESDGDEESDDAGDEGDGDADDKPETDAEDESETDGDSGEETEESNSGDEDEEGEEDEPESNPSASDEPDDEEEEEESDSSPGEGETGINMESTDETFQDASSGAEAKASEAGEGSAPSMSDIIKNGLNGEFGGSLATEVAEKAKSSEYLIYTDEFDTLGHFEDINFGILATDKQVADFERVVSHMMSPIQKDIERSICARSASTHTGGFRSGKLHASALSRLATGDDRIFRRKQINTTKDVAVSLVIDCSGSMNGYDKIKLAAYSAYTLSSVLDRLGINHEVIGFTTASLPYETVRSMQEESAKHGISYARYERLVMPVFKQYGEKMSMQVKRRLANINSGNLGSNVDGESITIAAKRLAMQKEKGKVMIVLSDGMPAVYGDIDISDHLADTVEQIETSGVNIVGIGINAKAVEKFYKKSIYVDHIDQLPTVVAKQLKTMLLAGAK